MSTAGNPLLVDVGGVVRERITLMVRGVLELLDRLIGSRRTLRLFALLMMYVAQFGATFWFAYELRWDFSPPVEFLRQREVLLLPIIVCKLLLLYSFGQFRSVLSYFGIADFLAVVFAMSFVSGIMLALWYGADLSAAPPRGVVLMDFVLSVGAIAAFRLSLRVARTWSVSGQVRLGAKEQRVGIVGAGDVGEALVRDLLSRRGAGRHPVFFIDDDPKKIGRTVHGLPVYGPIDRLAEIATRARVTEVVITLTAASPKRVKQIVEMGRQFGAKMLILPSFTQLAAGDVKVERTRPVVIEDLLGRAPVNLDSDGIARMIQGRIVMVTGAGGSIGSELCRQILAQQPQMLVMIDQTETVLFEIEQELLGKDRGDRILPLIVDVADEYALRAVFERLRPEIIFHAAAHKHVPLMERQPSEALKNNTLATAGLTRLASEYGVERFVFISTDKAINPTSVMGCSKRLAEKALLVRQHAAGNKTRFLAVRFGNVLGSSGSVIPTFRRQIAQGGPVTVTHPEMTRYFMTIPEAVGLVLQTATIGQGGEIFILDMSEPVKIIDMARQMIELSGYKPGEDIEIKITGLRPGEKLYEELRHTDETHEATEHPRIFKLRSEPASQDAEIWLAELRAVAAGGNALAIKHAMKRLVPEYTPFVEGEGFSKPGWPTTEKPSAAPTTQLTAV